MAIRHEPKIQKECLFTCRVLWIPSATGAAADPRSHVPPASPKAKSPARSAACFLEAPAPAT
jgi:hypothetical protein